MLQIGLERLLNNSGSYGSLRIGYLANNASTDRRYNHGRLLLQELFAENFRCLFSPQHGFWGNKQDNMIETDHTVDRATGLPVYSLYGEHRKPTPEMFTDIDVLFIDLIDVGTRVYTFIWTMLYCLQTAAETGKKIVILDRQNPIGGELVEGNILDPEYSSFVGLLPIPMRHGMTVGELALMFNQQYGIGADLEVEKVVGWSRGQVMRQTGFPWLPPSPNMPTPETALVYPGQVIWEGTNVSEGRGTTMPFEFVGAPFWDVFALQKQLGAVELPGCIFRPTYFEPTSGKWAATGCHGFHILVTDVETFRPYRTSLALLQACLKLYPEQFRYKEPPYEYEYEKLPMDMILGDQNVRLALERGEAIDEMERGWQDDLDTFLNVRENYLLYS